MECAAKGLGSEVPTPTLTFSRSKLSTSSIVRLVDDAQDESSRSVRISPGPVGLLDAAW